MHNKSNLVLLIAFVFVIFLFLYFFRNANQSNQDNVIVAGTGNPGMIYIYKFSDGSFVRKEINTGYNVVWTVRVGDIYNTGRNVIVAGVGNSFFLEPYGCQVVAYEPTASGWKKDVIDSNVDLRCKDIAIGDADNDGKNEVVLGTHGEGLLIVYKWNGTAWNSQTIEDNIVGQFDKSNNMNHRVPRENLTYDAVVQTAIHIVRIADVDNDGKNEIIATMSSPLEYKGTYPDLAFVRMYKWNGKEWVGSDIDRITNVKFRASIEVGDVQASGKNQLFITSAPHLLFLYSRNASGSWQRTVIDNQSVSREVNMKAMNIGTFAGKKELVVATGITNAVVYSYEWNGNQNQFVKAKIANVSEILEPNKVLPTGDNSLDVRLFDIDNDGRNEIVVGGESDTSWSNPFYSSSIPFGWETTPYGFLVVYKLNGSLLMPTILDTYSVLGMDVGKIQLS